jgi:hypothetical protein
MISANLRERYNLDEKFALPTFFLDCHYEEEVKEEKDAFDSAFTNILLSATAKLPYDPSGATAAAPKNVKLEEENKRLEDEKESY